MMQNEVGLNTAILMNSTEEMLKAIGEDPYRDGLKDTPERVAKSWKEIFSGYQQNPAEILSTAFDNEEQYDEMVILKNIDFHSMCEHHILPFFGRVHIGYLPGKTGKIVGISKLARLVECYSKRLQIQERMTQQIAKDLMNHLNAEGVVVIVEAQHLCMKMRGVKNSGSVMETSSVLGKFRESPEARAEALSLIGGSRG